MKKLFILMMIALMSVCVFAKDKLADDRNIMTKTGEAEWVDYLIYSSRDQRIVLDDNLEPTGKFVCKLSECIELYCDDSQTGAFVRGYIGPGEDYDANSKKEFPVRVLEFVLSKDGKREVMWSHRISGNINETRESFGDVIITDFVAFERELRFLMPRKDILWLVDIPLLDDPRGYDSGLLMKPICYMKYNSQPSLDLGRITEAVFLTPDIIRVADSTGAEYNIQVKHWIGDGRASSTREIFRHKSEVHQIWSNGKGSEFNRDVLYSADKYTCKVSKNQPEYKKSEYRYVVMNKKTKKDMQKKLDKYYETLKNK